MTDVKNLTAEEKYQRSKELARIRQKKYYYVANKEKINKKKQEIYKLGKQGLLTPPSSPVSVEPTNKET